MPTKQEIKEAQELINSGKAWRLEGSVGRWCMGLITGGCCMLGKVGHSDFYGNYVPSRTEVKSGTKGSAAYCKKMRKEREETGEDF